jgi:hypothetical protein
VPITPAFTFLRSSCMAPIISSLFSFKRSYNLCSCCLRNSIGLVFPLLNEARNLRTTWIHKYHKWKRCCQQ